jgi:hypothetical protein
MFLLVGTVALVFAVASQGSAERTTPIIVGVEFWWRCCSRSFGIAVGGTELLSAGGPYWGELSILTLPVVRSRVTGPCAFTAQPESPRNSIVLPESRAASIVL